MSTAIPSSMSYEMLSSLPANSFVLHWKEIRPDSLPQGNKYSLGTRQKVRFVIRGAPNEFLLNTNVYLCGNAYLKLKIGDLTAGQALSNTNVADFARAPSCKLNAPIHFFQSSRESFNAGALPYLDNQDVVRSHEINNLRYCSARRNRTEAKLRGIDDLNSSFYADKNTLVSSGIDTTDLTASAPIRLLYYNSDAAAVVTESLGKDKNFKIPLGLYSNFVNSHSVLPVGLTSSYAVNGWQIELDTTEQQGNDGKCYEITDVNGLTTTGEAVMSDLRIYAPYIRILDPAVMEAVLSLYEKRETVSVGGVQFPLSLRINTMAYRFASFPLINGQKDYFFRVAGTDRSVRAIAWWVFNKPQNLAGKWNLSNGENVNLKRLETKIGTENVHEVVEDTDTTTNNISNFIAVNSARSACLFSPLPYYQEGRKFDGMQEDDLDPYNNTLSNYSKFGTGGVGVNRRSLCYGYVSLENLDRREGDYSGSFQASGKDLTNVGAIEMNMRFVIPSAPAVNAGSTLDSIDRYNENAVSNSDYEILFAYAYDSITECSPQGMLDVTNAIL